MWFIAIVKRWYSGTRRSLMSACWVVVLLTTPIVQASMYSRERHGVNIAIDGAPINDIAIFVHSEQPKIAQIDVEPSDSGLDSVVIQLNGEVVLSSAGQAAKTKPISFKCAISLRPFGNELTVTVRYSNHDKLQRIVHPYLFQDSGPVAKQTVLLIPGPGSVSKQSIAAVTERFRTVPGVSTVDLSSERSTDASVISEIYKAAQRMALGDHLIVYYSGAVAGPTLQSSCIFGNDESPTSSSQSCLTVGSLVRVLSRLRVARVSALIDASVFVGKANGFEAADVKSSTPSSEISESDSWTESINGSPNFELLIGTSSEQQTSNKRVDTSPFTTTFLQWWDQHPGSRFSDACKSEADLASYIKAQRSAASTKDQPMLSVPLYLSTLQERDSSCFNLPSLPQIVLQIERTDETRSYFVGVSTAPLESSELIVSVNGIPIATQYPIQMNADRELHFSTFLNPGLNWVTVTAKTAATTIAQGSYLAEGRESPTLLLERARTEQTPKITLEQPLRSRITTELDNVTVIANLHNHGSKEGTYDISNNGTLIYQSRLHRTHLTDSIQKTLQVPLQPGLNTLSLRLHAQNGDAIREIRVTRTSIQPVLALLIGANQDAPIGGPSLGSAARDVGLMKDILLRYTDASPDDIVTLVGEDATRANIDQWLQRLNTKASAIGLIPGELFKSSQVTLIVFFSGYGISIPMSDTKSDGSNGEREPCLVTYKTEITNPGRECVPVKYLMSKMAAGGWDRSLAILDTSFSGVSGNLQLDFGGVKEYQSKTLPYLSSSSDNHEQSNDLSNNQTIIYASQPFHPALESVQKQQAVFTSSVNNALKELTGTERMSAATVTLSNVIDSANTTIRNDTHQDQNAYGQGDLTLPQLFKSVDMTTLGREWLTSFGRLSRDLFSMRSMDNNTLEYATRAVSKAELLDPNDPSVQIGRALVLRYEMLGCRKRSCAGLDQAEALLNKAEATLVKPPEQSQDKVMLYNLFSVRTAVHLAQGKLDMALKDASDAEETKISPIRASFILAELNFAKGDISEAARRLDDILTYGNENAANAEMLLSPSDWGRAVVWRAMCLYAIGERAQGASLLEAYVRQDTVRYKALIRPALLFSGRKGLQAEGTIGSEDSWMGLVANFLLGQRNKIDVENYAATTDRIDPRLFTCQSSFYLGLELLIRSRDSRGAAAKFSASVGTDATETGEYWLAKLFLVNPTLLRQ